MIKINNTKEQAKELATQIMQTGIIPIWDLDGVLFSAVARQLTNKDGSLNLDDYRKNSTPEKIARDLPLDLLEAIHILNKNNYPYHVATARVVCPSTAKLLAVNKVTPLKIMGRGGENDSRRDHLLKCDHLISSFSRRERERMILIDDNLNNCEAVTRIGVKAIHVNFNGH
jgi:hypothetical protein